MSFDLIVDVDAGFFGFRKFSMTRLSFWLVEVIALFLLDGPGFKV